MRFIHTCQEELHNVVIGLCDIPCSSLSNGVLAILLLVPFGSREPGPYATPLEEDVEGEAEEVPEEGGIVFQVTQRMVATKSSEAMEQLIEGLSDVTLKSKQKKHLRRLISQKKYPTLLLT